MVGDQCNACGVTNRYNPSLGNTSSHVDNVNLDQELNIYDTTGSSVKLDSVFLTSNAMHEYMKLQLWQYKREVTLNLTFAQVIATSSAYGSDYDGYIGIEPWGAKPNLKEGNFMW